MRKAFKWVGITLGAVIAPVVIAVGVVYLITNARFNKVYDVQVTGIETRADSATIAEGHRLVTIKGCFDCHGENLGGKVFVDDPALGTLYARNLTAGQGGAAARFSPADWVRAIRHGIRQDGKPLMFMPAQELQLSDGDLTLLVSYIKSVPPVDNVLPSSRIGPLGRVLYVSGLLPLVPAELVDHNAPPPSPTPGPTAEYGAYLALGCTGCHGETLSGGKIPGDPSGMVPLNLTPDRETGLGNWTEQDLFRALREGKKPDGAMLSDQMPWKMTRNMTDTEIKAVWAFLQTVPPRKFGGR